VIKSIILRDFRNYSNEERVFKEGLNIIIGVNGRGKTNLLEAIFFLLQGRSTRTNDVKEMIRKGSEEALVEGRFEIEGERKERVVINREEGARRGRRIDYLEAVSFQPDDMWMIKKGPEARRGALDEIIKGAKRGYAATTHEYQRILRQRNEAIKAVRKGAKEREYMRSWNPLLYQKGREITQERERMLKRVEKEMARAAQGWGTEEVSLRYYSSMGGKSEEEAREKILRMEEAEIRRGTTLIGPHRDEILFLAGGRNARRECSQGEQKILMIMWRLAQARLVMEDGGKQALLLMDDCLSELDEENKEKTIRELEKWGQALVTVTEDNSRFKGYWKVNLD
jgi:DNA replication and repair protein RecF